MSPRVARFRFFRATNRRAARSRGRSSSNVTRVPSPAVRHPRLSVAK
jgi:hypothetical protein